jgi:uncharacterized small protein (DUF1192 family)
MCLPARLSLASAAELAEKIHQLAGELARCTATTAACRRRNATALRCWSASARGSFRRSRRCG